MFTVSRIKEGPRTRAIPTRRAIHDGIARSAGVITSAAIIMVFVFLTFATLRQTGMKQLGVGLAFAVVLDATVVRTVLLPAAMGWLGRAQLAHAAQGRRAGRAAACGRRQALASRVAGHGDEPHDRATLTHGAAAAAATDRPAAPRRARSDQLHLIMTSLRRGGRP